MTENTINDNEFIDKPVNPESENTSDNKNISIDQESINQNKDSEIMEVHHHPELHHNPKPWKEYFLEFLMIFLAVTLGFFAENTREHFIENKRVKEYAQSLYDDLKNDTTVIQRTFDEKLWIIAKFDSAQNLLFSNELSQNTEFIYFNVAYLYINDRFTSQDVTYQQLRNSGNFRYIKNIDLYKKLADYYNLHNKYLEIEDNFDLKVSDGLPEIQAKIFNVTDFNSLNNPNGNSYYNVFLPSKKKLTPLIYDEKSIKLLYLKFGIAKLHNGASIQFLSWLKSNATDLLLELKNEYKLKD
jgi:hypothetical protein